MANKSQVQCTATPVNRGTDPNLTVWNKSSAPLMLAKPDPGQTNFRDVTTGWRWPPVRARASSGSTQVEWRVAVGATVTLAGQPRGVAAVYRGRSFGVFAPEPVELISGTDEVITPRPSMWECPDVFELTPNVAVLKYSADPHDYYSIGRWSSTGSFAGGTPARRLDQGSVYYASKSQTDSQGRRIIWAWVREEPSWGGCQRATQRCSLQSLPRVVTAEVSAWTGVRSLRFAPLPELSSLRIPGSNGGGSNLRLRAGEYTELLPPSAAALHAEVLVALNRSTAAVCPNGALELVVFRSAGEEMVVRIAMANLTADAAVVEVGRSASGPQASRLTPAVLHGATWLDPIEAEPELKLHVFADATVVETFLNGGRLAMTARAYPAAPAAGVGLRAVGCDLAVRSALAFTLAPIWQ